MRKNSSFKGLGGLSKKWSLGPPAETQKLLRGVFESLDEALFVVASKTRTILDCNPAVEKVFGYRPEEVIGRTTALLHLNRRMFLQFQKMISPSLEKKRPFQTEYQMRRKDGSVFLSEHVVTRVTKPGSPPIAVSLVRDVTEIRRSQELLQEQRDLALALCEARDLQETLQLSLEAALRVSGLEGGGIYLRDDRDGSLRIAFHRGLSPSFVRATGCYKADSENTRLVMKGKTVYGRHDQMQLPLSSSERREGLKALGVIPIRHEGRVIGCLNVASRKNDNVPQYSRTALEAIAFQIGQSIRRIRVEEDLRRSEQSYTLAEGLANNGHWERDQATQKAVWSPGIFRILGLDPQKGVLNFSEFMDRVHSEDREKLRGQMEATLHFSKRQDKPRQSEFRIIRPDGTVRELLTTIEKVQALRSPSSKLRGIVQDITDRKEMENRIAAISRFERESVQRDLHDTVGQQLSGLAFLAESVKENVSGYSEQADRDLDKIIQLNQEALEQAREIARELTPLSDDPQALDFSLHELTRYISRIYKVPCRYTSPGQIFRSNSEVSTQLFLIAREAAINAAKHAQASVIRISLSSRKKGLRLRVTDDGRGLDLGKKKEPGLGLEIMRQRSDLIGAHLRIYPGKKQGTVVECIGNGIQRKRRDSGKKAQSP